MIYKIGVDGGGTKTECILVDSAGRIVARHLAPGCNPSISGAVQAKRTATQALAALRKQVPAKAGSRAPSSPKSAVALTLLCMAGPLEFWREFAEGLRGFGRVLAADDSLPVLELATRGWPGLVLHAGTGSFVAARESAGSKGLEQRLGDARYAGGLGWRFGDEGSGYDIGRRAVARALLELQGWELPSRLSALVRDQMGRGDAPAIFTMIPRPTPASPRSRRRCCIWPARTNRSPSASSSNRWAACSTWPRRWPRNCFPISRRRPCAPA